MIVCVSVYVSASQQDCESCDYVEGKVVERNEEILLLKVAVEIDASRGGKDT